jgi:iron complex outermembrane receptor protein
LQYSTTFTRLVKRIKHVLLASAAAGVLLPAAAFAQDAAPKDEGPTLDEVVVTAQRREEKLQDVPVTVSAFTSEQIDKLNVRGGDDLAKITPGMTFVSSGTTPQVSLRGVGTRGVSAGEESTVPIYIDGIYQPHLSNTLIKLNSISRVEVLKGPQSTLYGRNATGGAINVITRDPPVGFTVLGSASYGSYDEADDKLYVGGGTETFGADLAAIWYSADGYLHDIASNSDRGDSNQYTVRGKLQWRPTDNMKFTLTATQSQANDRLSTLGKPLDGTVPQTIQYVPTPPIASRDYDVSLGRDIETKFVQSNVALLGYVDFGPVNLNLVSSYMRNSQKNWHNNQNASNAPVFDSMVGSVATSYYNEAYLQSSGDNRFDWIVGATTFSDEIPYSIYQLSTYNYTTHLYSTLSHHNKVESSSYAIYAQGTFDILDNLSITAGGRYTEETREFAVRGLTVGPTTTPLGPYTVPPVPTNGNASKTFTQFSPSATLQWKPMDNLNIYAKYAEGFKSGLFSPSGSNLVPAEPESIKQYELGFKYDPYRWLRLNGSIYYSDYTNLQGVSRNPITLAPVLQNAASASIKGGEFEVFVTPVTNLELRLGLAVVDGEYEEWKGAQITFPSTTIDPPAATPCQTGTGPLIGGNRSAFCDVSGNPIQRVPKYQALMGASYTWELGESAVTASVNGQYQSEFNWEPGGRIVEPSRFLLDGRVTWDLPGDQLTISVWGNNLTDEKYLMAVSASAFSDYGLMARPRTVGVELSFKYN